MVNTPIPHSLRSEAKKAAKILREFSMPNAKTGPDKLIPAGILAKAKGLAIITVFKAGFLVTARGGSGVVIAKLDDDPIDFASGWSAPSAIGLAGLGGGFEIGAEVTDFVIILNTRSAVDAFSKGGNLTLGGNFTIAAGPLGRNVEGDIAVRSPAAIYTYSKTKGIFAGISVEGSALIERKDANRKFYGKEIRAHQILSGQVDPPDDCRALYEVMREHQEFALKAAANMVKDKVVEKSSSRTSRFSFSRSRSTKSNLSSSSRSKSEWYLPRDPSPSASSEPGRKESRDDSSYTERSTRIVNAVNLSDTKDPWDKYDRRKASAASAQASFHRREYDSDDDDDAVWAVADFPFQGELGCDLSFRAGDRIKVVTRTRNQQDWWEGLDSSGHQGIFPANFVHVVS